MTAVIPSPKSNSVRSAKDLKPKMESFLRIMALVHPFFDVV
jgi:hypothetical protein